MSNRIIPFILLLFIAAMFNYCGKDTSSAALPSTIVWEKDQSSITPATGAGNAWCGFDIKKDLFVSTKTISKFIVWRAKHEEQTITVEYLLRGLPVKVLVNSKEAFDMKPDSEAGKVSAAINLSKGINFIEFHRAGNAELKIKRLEIGGPGAERSHDLVEGEAFSRYHPAGAGTIRLKGKGKVLFHQVEYKEGKESSRDKEIKTGFFSNTVEYAFRFEAQGFIRVSVEAGKFNISGYDFTVEPRKEASDTNEYADIMKEKSGIHIFLIDGCHAGHLGVYGYERDTSPNIDRYAREAVVFDNAYANATFTRSSVASIFTGFYPHRHKLRVLTNVLPKGLFMLPEFMRSKGYKTAIFTEAGNISEKFGFAQGVDEYRKVFRRWDDPQYLKNNMFAFFCEWLEDPGPLFTYIHFRAPHFPIVPPPPYLDMYKRSSAGVVKKQPIKSFVGVQGPAARGADNELFQKSPLVAEGISTTVLGKKTPRRGEPVKTFTEKSTPKRIISQLTELGKQGHKFTPEEVRDVVDDYDSAIRYVDAQVGELLDKLKKEGRYDSSLIIFTSDHGEALYEHGMWGHGQNVYPETSRVPLIVKFPARMNLKGRVQRVTQLVDIFPTIAGLLEEKHFFDGESILESIRLKELDDRFAFSTSFGVPPSIGIRWRGWYYIIHRYNNEKELFNLHEDPLRNLAGLEENRDLMRFFRSRFIDWYVEFDNIERTGQSMDLNKLPKDELDNLKSLGYIE